MLADRNKNEQVFLSTINLEYTLNLWCDYILIRFFFPLKFPFYIALQYYNRWMQSWTEEVLHSSWIIQIKAWNLWLHIFGTWELELNALLCSVGFLYYLYVNIKAIFIIKAFLFILLFRLSFFWRTHASFCHQFGSLLV